MAEERGEIYVKCLGFAPLAKPASVRASRRHEYSPISIEVGILQEIEKSTESLRASTRSICKKSPEFDLKIDEFLTSRREYLHALKSLPEVNAFINHIRGLEGEIEREIDIIEEEKEVEKSLEGEVEEESDETAVTERMEDEDSWEIGENELVEDEYDNLLDAVSDAIAGQVKGEHESSIEKAILDYVDAFLGLLNWLVDHRFQIRALKIGSEDFRALIADIITVDSVFIAGGREDIGTEKSFLIPLDLSPMRITLAILLAKPDIDKPSKNWNRVFSPPVSLLFKAGIPRIAKPYRTFDGHPIMMHVPLFTKNPEIFQEEVKSALRAFREEMTPLINKVKGLTAATKRSARPPLVKNDLASLLSLYLKFNPLSIENLRVLDLGTGSGALVSDTLRRLLEQRSELRDYITISILLNDLVGEPGRSLRRDSQTEEFLDKLDILIWEGDMRGLIKEVKSTNAFFDVAFINRVFDIYGGYSVFSFGRRELDLGNLCRPTAGTERVPPFEIDESVEVFSGYAGYEQVWRAIRFLLDLSLERDPGTVFLPAVHMNVIKNFFTWGSENGLQLLMTLLSIAELVIVSVFPGDFETLFPLGKQNGIFHFSITKPHAYSIICISSKKRLIDFVKSNFRPE